MGKYNSSIILDFKGVNLFRRRNMVKINSAESLQKVRNCLQQRRSVQIMFDGSLEPVKARYIDFLSGMSGYFGTDMKFAR